MNKSGVTRGVPTPVVFHSLTNEQSRQNWEMYGNPDGPGGEWRLQTCSNQFRMNQQRRLSEEM